MATATTLGDLDGVQSSCLRLGAALSVCGLLGSKTITGVGSEVKQPSTYTGSQGASIAVPPRILLLEGKND